MHIFACFLFCLCLPRVISGFYEEDSRKVVESINKQIIQGLNVATAERRPRNYARNFGAKIQRKVPSSKATSLNQYLPKLNNNVRPKRKERINVNLSQFVSNDIPFVPSRRIPLLPSLRERSGAAIKYAKAEKLVAADNLFPIINKPIFKPSLQTTFHPITTQVSTTTTLTTTTTTATSTKRSNRRIRIPFRPRKTYIVKQDLSRPNNTITSNFVPKVPIITKIDSTTDDSYHYLVTIETTTDSSIEEIKDYKPESKNQKINDYQEYFDYDDYSSAGTQFFDTFFDNDLNFGFGRKFQPPDIGSHFSKGVLFQDENIFQEKVNTESPYDKYQSSPSHVTRRPAKHTTTPLDTQKNKHKYQYLSTRRPNLYSSVLFHTREPTLSDDSYEVGYDKYWSKKNSRKKDNFPSYEITTDAVKTTTEYPDIILDDPNDKYSLGTRFPLPPLPPSPPAYPDIILDDPNDKYSLGTKFPPPPLPPSPPALPKLPKSDLGSVETNEEWGKRIKIKRKRPKRIKKGRIRKKDLNKKPSSAKKRSLAFQYKVLDMVNLIAYWTSLLSILAFAIAL